MTTVWFSSGIKKIAHGKTLKGARRISPLKFVVALQEHRLLSRQLTEIVTTGKIEVGGAVGKYAYGFNDKIFNGKHIVGHNGGAPGIAANLDIFPELGYTAVILSNYDPPAMMPIIMKIRELIPAAPKTRAVAAAPRIPG